MARKVGQILHRGDRRWLVRVYLGREASTRRRRYHNQTIHGGLRDAQQYLNHPASRWNRTSQFEHNRTS